MFIRRSSDKRNLLEGQAGSGGGDGGWGEGGRTGAAVAPLKSAALIKTGNSSRTLTSCSMFAKGCHRDSLFRGWSSFFFPLFQPQLNNLFLIRYFILSYTFLNWFLLEFFFFFLSNPVGLRLTARDAQAAKVVKLNWWRSEIYGPAAAIQQEQLIQ